MIKNDKSNNGNHLDLSSRIEIERMLGENRSVTVIAKALDKSQTTVSREIKKRRVFAGRKDPETNRCAKKRNCLVKGLCEGHCTLKCSSCKTGKCNSLCDEFINDACERIVKAPYVCNGCKKVTGCKLDRYKYSAERAEKGYKAELSESRQGISLSEAEMAELDKIITPGIRNGQSVAHIISSNIGKIPVGEATLYRYLEEGYFSVTGFDMRRKLHYKPRTKRKETKEQDLKAYEGRRFSDFTEFMANHDVPFVQMDTLHGAKGTSKCLLTFYLMNGAVLLAFLLDACTQEEVKRVFDMIEFRIGPKAFHDTFPVILTDRGSEFKRPELLETSIKGGRRCHVFYCDPNAPFQKPEIEKIHSLIRYFFPKQSAYNTGSKNTFENTSQDKITLMVNHINSYKRGSLGGLAPFDLMEKLLDKRVVKNLSLELIPAKDVTLRPELLIS